MAHGSSGRGPDPRKRTSGAGPRGASRRTPGGSTSTRPAAVPGRGRARVAARRVPGSGPSRDLPARPRFTGRAAILVLVVALLMMSYASSMRAYLDQRRHLAEPQRQHRHLAGARSTG